LLLRRIYLKREEMRRPVDGMGEIAMQRKADGRLALRRGSRELLYNRKVPAVARERVAGRVGEMAEWLKAAVC
jgi:hypothetical protein